MANPKADDFLKPKTQLLMKKILAMLWSHLYLRARGEEFKEFTGLVSDRGEVSYR